MKLSDPLIDHIIEFVATIKHRKPAITDHIHIMRHKHGMCGGAAVLCHVLFDAFGIPSRIMAIGRVHIICEFLYSGLWRIADTNLFSKPLLNLEGTYLTRRDVKTGNYDLQHLIANKKHDTFIISKFLDAVKSPIRYPLYYSPKRRKLLNYTLFVCNLFKSLIFIFIPLSKLRKLRRNKSNVER